MCTKQPFEAVSNTSLSGCTSLSGWKGILSFMLRRFESSLKHSPRVKRRREKASHHVFIITSFAFFSPRRRSKTPERGERFKRNVHFQDEEKYDENNARESSNSDERNRQDTREIVHPDGKVMFN